MKITGKTVQGKTLRVREDAAPRPKPAPKPKPEDPKPEGKR